MKVPYFLRMVARPEGPLSGIIARLLNAGNARLNARCMAALPDRPDQVVLDVGFGGGVGLRLALDDTRISSVAGIDPSSDMVEAANVRHQRRPPRKPVDIRVGVAEHLPWADGVFDAVVSVNTVYYWSDVEAGFREARRVLHPTGTFVLGLRDKQHLDRAHFERYGFRSPSIEDIREALVRAGFGSVQVSDLVPSRTGGEIVVSAWPGHRV